MGSFFVRRGGEIDAADGAQNLDADTATHA
jgi:hypothetical protein